MPGATYTETVLSDNVTITCRRVRVAGSLDWIVRLETQVLDQSGGVVRYVDVDVATLFSPAALNSFKTTLTNGVTQLATNRGIDPGS